METNGRTLKISIVGADKSGKTALTVRFLTGKFIYEYSSGHNVVYQHNFLTGTVAVPLEIVDTSGDENITDVVDGSNGVVIVYAIDCEKSFHKAQEILSNVINENKNLPYIALVGNKSDLWPYKTVERDDGKGLAEQHKCEYFELSALSCRDGVREMFSSVIQISMAKSKPRSLSLPINMTLRQSSQDRAMIPLENRGMMSQLQSEDRGMMSQLPYQDRGRATSLISFQTVDEEEPLEVVESRTRPISVCRKFMDSVDGQQKTCKSLYSSSSVGDVREYDNKNVSKIVRRALTEVAPVEKTPPVENKSGGILHKTLGDVGLIAFSTLQLPMSSKEKRPRSPFSRRREKPTFLPMPLLVGKTL